MKRLARRRREMYFELRPAIHPGGYGHVPLLERGNNAGKDIARAQALGRYGGQQAV